MDPRRSSHQHHLTQPGMLESPVEQLQQQCQEQYSFSSRQHSSYQSHPKYRASTSYDNGIGADNVLPTELAARSGSFARHPPAVAAAAAGEDDYQLYEDEGDEGRADTKRRCYGVPQLDLNNRRAGGVVAGGVRSAGPSAASAVKRELGDPKWKGGSSGWVRKSGSSRRRPGELLLSPRSAVAAEILHSLRGASMPGVGSQSSYGATAAAGELPVPDQEEEEEDAAAAHGVMYTRVGHDGRYAGSKYDDDVEDDHYAAAASAGGDDLAAFRSGYVPGDHMPQAVIAAAAGAARHSYHNPQAAAAGVPGFRMPQAAAASARASEAAGNEGGAELPVGAGARSSTRLQHRGRMDWSALRSF